MRLLDLRGATVTVDALNCQRAIAQQIVDQEGDYVMALKGNQQSLHDDVQLFFDDPKSKVETAKPAVDGDHGRIETRIATVSTDIDWLQEIHHWPGLEAIGKMERIREKGGKTTTETAYYLLSSPLTSESFGAVTRCHWGVENQLHWRLDVTMGEDQQRNRLDNGPNNLAVLRHMALNLIGKDKSKGSLPKKLRRAALNETFLAKPWLSFEMRLPWLPVASGSSERNDGRMHHSLRRRGSSCIRWA